jgi:hypothetical protein
VKLKYGSTEIKGNTQTFMKVSIDRGDHWTGIATNWKKEMNSENWK